MLQLKENEKIILAVHKHWLVLFGRTTIVLIFFLIGFAGFYFISGFVGENVFLYRLSWFLFIIYFLILYIISLVLWMDHYLDMWIITDERILDIEHAGVFRREVSEFLISQVQDVTIQVPGMLASFLKYGNIRVQTAGEKFFESKDIPNPEKIKDLIIEYSRRKKV